MSCTKAEHEDHWPYGPVDGCRYCLTDQRTNVVPEDEIEAIAGMGVRFKGDKG